MQLDRLTISGITTFREPVTLDLLAIPEGSLVAICGHNGEGKTTLLDSVLAPLYLTMPSRRGSLASYATSASAFLEATYRLDADLVRARVTLDGPRRESRAVLEVDRGDQDTITDGKIKSYQAAVGRYFPPLELTLASAFASQTRAGSFVTATPGQRKDLFSTALGLEQFAAWAETAKAAAALVEKTIARIEGRLGVLAGLTAPAAADALEVDLGRARQAVLETRDAVELLRGDQTALERRRTELAVRLEVYYRAQEAHRAAQAAALGAANEGGALLRERDASVQAASQARRRAIQATEADLRDLTAQKGQANRAAEAELGILAKKVEANRELLASADEIRERAARKAAAVSARETLRGQIDACRETLDENLALERAARTDLHALEKVEARLEEARRQAAIVDEVPCEGKWITLTAFPPGWELHPERPILTGKDAGGCRFLVDAKTAAASIPKLEAHVDARRPLEEAIALHSQAVLSLETLLRSQRLELEAQTLIIDKAGDVERYLAHLAQGEARIEGYQAQMTTVLATQAARLQDLDQRLEVRRAAGDTALKELDDQAAADLAALVARRARIEATITQADDELRAAAAELTRTAGAAAAVDDVVAQLKDTGDRVARRSADLATAESLVQRLEDERQERERNLVELARLETAEAGARQELVVWATLARCFGRDGLPTLEIANAGPTVSSLTNELLEVAYGPRFTVEVKTQVLRADGKGLKEDFTIEVLDNQAAGAVRDIGDLSGGERVLVEEALRAAIMIFVNSRNVTPIRTICRDETTGALDPENAVRYVAMLRRLVALAGAAHCLFITHNPECAELADVVLDVAGGRVERRAGR